MDTIGPHVTAKVGFEIAGERHLSFRAISTWPLSNEARSTRPRSGLTRRRRTLRASVRYPHGHCGMPNEAEPTCPPSVGAVLYEHLVSWPASDRVRRTSAATSTG